MWPRLLSLVAMLALLLGDAAACAMVSDDEPPPFEGVLFVRVSADVSDGWRRAFANAVGRWGVLLNDVVRFDVGVLPVESESLRVNTIEIVSSRGPDLFDARDLAVTERYRREDGRTLAARIRILKTGEDDDARHWTALHELGHALGLDHDVDREHDSVMWPRVSYPIKIGCEDWRRACRTWGCREGCEGQRWL